MNHIAVLTNIQLISKGFFLPELFRRVIPPRCERLTTGRAQLTQMVKQQDDILSSTKTTHARARRHAVAPDDARARRPSSPTTSPSSLLSPMHVVVRLRLRGREDGNAYASIQLIVQLEKSILSSSVLSSVIMARIVYLCLDHRRKGAFVTEGRLNSNLRQT